MGYDDDVSDIEPASSWCWCSSRPGLAGLVILHFGWSLVFDRVGWACGVTAVYAANGVCSRWWTVSTALIMRVQRDGRQRSSVARTRNHFSWALPRSPRQRRLAWSRLA